MKSIKVFYSVLIGLSWLLVAVQARAFTFDDATVGHNDFADASILLHIDELIPHLRIGPYHNEHRHLRHQRTLNEESSCNSTLGELEFLGHEFAISGDEGQLDLRWTPATFVSFDPEDPFECENVQYLIFLGPIDYEYDNETSIPDLLQDDDFVVFISDSDTGGNVDGDFTAGEEYSLLVVASAENDVYSTIIAPGTIRIAGPAVPVNEDAWKGFFEASGSLDIVYDPENNEIAFTGTLPEELDSVQVYDNFAVVTSDDQELYLNVTDVLVVDDAFVQLEVVEIALADLFEDFSADFDMDFTRQYSPYSSTDDEEEEDRLRKLVTAEVFDKTYTCKETASFGPLTIENELTIAASMHLTLEVESYWRREIKAIVDVKGSVRSKKGITFQAEAAKGWKFERTLVTLPKIRIRFFIWVIPVWINITPKVKVKGEAEIKLEGEAHVTVTDTGRAGLRAGYEQGRFVFDPSASYSNEIDVGVSAKLSVTAGAYLVFNARVLVYSFIPIDFDLGLGLEAGIVAEAIFNPVVLQVGPPFHLTMFDLDFVAKAAANDHDVTLYTKKLLGLPTVELSAEATRCPDDGHAIDVIVTAQGKDFTGGLLVNRIQEQHIWLDDFAPTESTAEAGAYAPQYVLTDETKLVAHMALPRDIDQRMYALPSGKMWFRTTPRIPSFISYTIINSTDIPNLGEFECCDDPRCEDLYPDENKRCDLTDYRCRVLTGTPTFAPTPNPTYSPDSSSTLPPTPCPSLNSKGTCGGDPHIARWTRGRDSFHGECDLVLVHSEQFHDGAGLDLHVRTTISSYFSYVETAAVRMGHHVLEIQKEQVIWNGEAHAVGDTAGATVLSFSSFQEDGNQDAWVYQYQYKLMEKTKDKSIFVLHLGDTSSIEFRFYKQFLTVSFDGHLDDLEDAVGLLGRYSDGTMWDRQGRPFDLSFEDYAFEWQFDPAWDAQLFQTLREPQLPYERCRLPTAARPNRRQLLSLRKQSDGGGGGDALWEQAHEACIKAGGEDLDLCIDDILTTGDVGLAEIW